MKSLRPRLATTLIAAAFSAVLCTITPTANADVLSFGFNANGKTGLGTTSGIASVATPIVTTNLIGHAITQVSAGAAHSLLLAADGSVFSMGINLNGRTGLGIGDGSGTTVATPIVITNLDGRSIIQVAAGGNQSLFLANDGTVFSSGYNGYGATGLGTTVGAALVATPIDTTNLSSRKITQVAAGELFSLLLADDGSVFSFGDDTYGRTGLGFSTTVATPIDTTNLGGRKIIQVAALFRHSLLLAEDGSVFAFGNNQAGELGLGTTSSSVPIATPIDTTNLGSLKITQVAAGVDHSLLLAENGSVFSFGNNGYGQTGLGVCCSTTLVATPIVTTNLGGRKITEVAAGGQSSLLVAEDGTVFSFGYNFYGATGLGTTSGYVSIATPIDTTHLGGLRATHVDAGAFHSLMLAEPRLPGDYNNDGTVDAADYVVWRHSVGQMGAGLAADGDQDYQVDADDYDVWRSHFGQTAGSGSVLPSAESLSATVPESRAIALALLGLIGIGFARTRNNASAQIS